MDPGCPRTEHDPDVNASYTCLAPGGIPAGSVDRTLEAGDGMHVDVGADGRVVGVEVIGDGDWRAGLVALAMQGRLRVEPKNAG